jgi:DNA-binding MarR family transcriptional regulator
LLVERGLIERRVSANDARRAELRLTEAGRVVKRRAPRPAQADLVNAIHGLRPRELEGLCLGLRSLATSIGAHEEEPSMFFEEERR